MSLQHHAHDPAVRLALDTRHCLSVDIHRRRDAGVAHQFLLHFEWSALHDACDFDPDRTPMMRLQMIPN